MNMAGIAGLVMIACGLASWWVAKHRGLPYANRYFFYGFIFGFVGLAVVAFNPASWLGVKKEPKEPKEVPPSLDSEWPPTPTSRIDHWRSQHPQ